VVGVAGVAAGLAIATKETSVIVLPAALAAAAIAWWSGSGRRHVEARPCAG
jgi:4-amino-4-deoxy-L-arabinose transferase-like glycosyltransferase